MKDRARRTPRRKQPRPKLDDELLELVEILDERRVDRNAAGWFSVPWRDGWNAVWLARTAWFTAYHKDPQDRMIDDALLEWIEKRSRSAEIYWLAGEWLSTAARGQALLRAALRCVQVLVSCSDGAGEVYNAILRPTFEKLALPEKVEPFVEEARMRDALGFTARDPDDVRRVRAFKIAWSRGLYRAAYAV